MFIITKHTHMNDRGMQIEEHEVIAGEVPQDFSRFVGVATIGVQTPRGTYPHTFGFPIDVENELPRIEGLIKAFEIFEESLKKAAPAEIKKLQQQMMEQQKSLIVPSSAMPDNKIQIP